MKITDFYETCFIDAASYDNLRKIASVCDGLKNSGRKIVYTTIEKNVVVDAKVSRLQSSISEFTDYLHGEDNLGGVIVNMARRFIGTNQLPLLKAEGNFGKRFKPKASASRYIFTRNESFLNKLFIRDDKYTLQHQTFEGLPIEPRYMVPILPLILINGSRDAVSTGFYQNILPRGIRPMIDALHKYLKDGKIEVPKPYWDGFRGEIETTDSNQKWVVRGKFTKKSAYVYEITELPIGHNLVSYKKILNKLQDNKVIVGYTDNSDNDIFNYSVKVNREFLNKYDTDKKILKILELETSYNEHYNVMGKDNRILEFKTAEEVFEEYIRVREDHYIKRKEFLIKKIQQDIKLDASKFLFIKAVNENKIQVNNNSKENIINQILNIKGIIKKDDSFDYLLNMPIYSLTKEKMDSLFEAIKGQKLLLTETQNKDVKDLWKEDLEQLTKTLKKENWI